MCVSVSVSAYWVKWNSGSITNEVEFKEPEIKLVPFLRAFGGNIIGN